MMMIMIDIVYMACLRTNMVWDADANVIKVLSFMRTI